MPFESRICVDTAPLLERSYARLAGLGWIGKNTCLINEPLGSWFFLGELLVSLEIEPDASAARPLRHLHALHRRLPDRRDRPGASGYAVDSRLCISYFTIELRGAVPEEQRAGIGSHVFGCDICQDVCPWNRRAPVDRRSRLSAAPFRPAAGAPGGGYRGAVPRDVSGNTGHARPLCGFLRNVAIAMGNAACRSSARRWKSWRPRRIPVVASHARAALRRLLTLTS